MCATKGSLMDVFLSGVFMPKNSKPAFRLYAFRFFPFRIESFRVSCRAVSSWAFTKCVVRVSVLLRFVSGLGSREFVSFRFVSYVHRLVLGRMVEIW